MANENDGAPVDSGASQGGDNGASAQVSDVLATLRHDPFPGGQAPKADKGAKAPKGDKGGNSAAAKPQGKDGKAPDGGSPASQPGMNTPASDPEKDALRQSLETANQLIDAYKGGRNSPQAPAAPEGGGNNAPARREAPAQGGDGPQYNFNIPQQLVAALTSDKPEDFVKGLQGFATGVALAVHQQMIKQLQPQIEAALSTHVPRMLTPALEGYNTRKAIFDDFYGTYKELNNPRLYNTIAQTTQDVMTELRTNQWSPAVRDTVATRVKQMLASAMGGGYTAPSQGNAPALPAHPKMGGGSGSRPSVPNPNDMENDIMATLF